MFRLPNVHVSPTKRICFACQTCMFRLPNVYVLGVKQRVKKFAPNGCLQMVIMFQNLNLKATKTTPILSRVSAFHILILHPIELRESSARTASKSITARTTKSIKSCFPTETRQTQTRSQVNPM